MADVVDRALGLWGEPVPAGDGGAAAFRSVYIDPVVVNGVRTPVADLVERARMLHGAIAGLTHHVDDVVVTPGRRAVAFRIRGRHVGPLVTPLGIVAPSGRAVEVAGIDIFEVDEAADRVTGIWAVADLAGLVASLGAGDGPSPPGRRRLAAATVRDAPELLVLQRCCWVQEAVVNDTLEIPALHEALEDVRAGLRAWSTWCLRLDGRLVGAVRARRDGSEWEIGRLMVAPDVSGQGLGRELLRHAEAQAPAGVDTITLFTGLGSARNLRLYERAGYVRTDQPAPPHAVRLVKPLTAR